MTDQVKSQILGISLALTTAIGCIAYEKLVKNFGFGIIILAALLFYVPAMGWCIWYSGSTVASDVTRLLGDRQLLLWGIVYVLTWCTTPLWYVITKKQGVMVGSIYEVKYIIMLAIIYILLGDRPLTTNTAIGVAFALVSVYFISKN